MSIYSKLIVLYMRGGKIKMYTEQEFNEIYKMYAQELFNISFGYTHNKNDSEDIIQQVFMKFLNNKKKRC